MSKTVQLPCKSNLLPYMTDNIAFQLKADDLQKMSFIAPVLLPR